MNTKTIKLFFALISMLFIPYVANAQQYVIQKNNGEEIVLEYSDVNCIIFRDAPKPVEHKAVDLGLPSGLKWATCNIGANSPEENGDFFAWGEIAPKDEYSFENCLMYGNKIENISGNPQYDAARANWGGNWRMPTHDEINELIDNCKWKFTTQNNVSGMLVTGKNGNSIFLPASGDCFGTSHFEEGEKGHYWSSMTLEGDDGSAVNLYFQNFGNYGSEYGARYLGRVIRAVIE